MKKVLKTFSLIVIFFFLLSMFGWMAIHISKEDKSFGFLDQPVKFLYSFPDLFSQSVEEVKTLPLTFVPTPKEFRPVNKLKNDFKVLTSYSDTKDSRSIALMNLKNDSVLYKWTLNNPYNVHDRILNPLLLGHKSLVYAFDGVSGLRRIDSTGNVIWTQDSVYAHHSMNLDSDGNIWICSFKPGYDATGKYKLDGRTVYFKDNFITKIDPETGKILFHKSVANILKENNLADYLLKSMVITDPIHLNDVEPALKTTKYYHKGDLLISLRSPSIVFQYRPSTDKILKVIEGPFVSQHDVDFLTDSTIVVFNNNYYSIRSFKSRVAPKDSSQLNMSGDFYSNIVRYDLGSSRFSFIGDSIFRANEIFTESEGLIDFINPTTYFVEEQNKGVIWIIKDNRVLYKNVFKSHHKGYHHLTNWTRVIQGNE